MSTLLADPHIGYVALAYGATVIVIGGLVALTVRANARARREMAEAERETVR
ncbi:MAG: heme exporter protein CcmD [Pseudomonadota bacterium]